MLPSGTLSFAPNETSKTLSIYVFGDAAIEPDESFTVTLLNASDETPIIVPTATGTILNDDAIPPAVERIVINDGSAQRSRVTSLTVTFNQVVTVDGGAFEILKKGIGGGLVALLLSPQITDGKTVVTLTFTGSLTEYGSLKDGDYQLTIHSSRIHSTNTGRTLDGDGDGISGGEYRFGHPASNAFFRLYGDSDGDRDVDNLDFARFRTTMNKRSTDAAFLSYFDFEGDNDVDNLDFARFAARMGKHLDFVV
jgi:hypothetical protein